MTDPRHHSPVEAAPATAMDGRHGGHRASPASRTAGPGRKPEWLKKPLPRASSIHEMESMLRTRHLHTVCESARCPNKGECFERGTATFLIMGGTCTRDCGFCSVEHGLPGPLDPAEPAHVADAAATMGLQHVVVTSVTRDDLSDGGAAHFAATMRAIRSRIPGATVEVLIPDLRGVGEAIDVVLAEVPDVFNHNVETVRRLYPVVRPQADFQRSLRVLARAAGDGRCVVKTGFMLGLGETGDEVRGLLATVADAGVEVVTVGQYLRPSRGHLPVVEYVDPEVFVEHARFGEGLGLRVEAAPFVRSSYRAEESLRRGGGMGSITDGKEGTSARHS